jgi:hypothetical protein
MILFLTFVVFLFPPGAVVREGEIKEKVYFYSWFTSLTDLEFQKVESMTLCASHYHRALERIVSGSVKKVLPC